MNDQALRLGPVMALALTTFVAQAQEVSDPSALTLEQAVKAALANNPVLDAARSEVRAAEAGVRLARSRKGPAVSANGFATAGNTSPIYSTPPRTDPPAWMVASTDVFLAANLSLMLPIYTGGVLEAGISSARGAQRAAVSEQTEMRSETALMTVESFLMALRAEEMAKAEQARVGSNEEMLRTTRLQLEAGRGIEASVRRAEAELAMARRELATAENERSKALVDLGISMGLDRAPEGGISAPDKIEPAEPLDQLLSKASTRRGAVLAARARLEAARADVRAMEGQLKPQVYGMAMADAMNDEMMKGGVSAGIVASFPLFDSGMRRADIARMRAMRDMAAARLKETELRVQGEIRKAWLDYETAVSVAESSASAVAAAQAAYDVMVVRVESGKSILVEQLDALQALTRARTDFAQALFDRHLAIARLHQAAGIIPGTSEPAADSSTEGKQP